jgi:hypothetical protein
MLQFGGIDPMEKQKRQRGARSGGGILSYMHKFGKMTFYQKTLKIDPTLKNNFPISKVTLIITSPQKVKNHSKRFSS